MSIENVQQMIEDAPEASIWWAAHQKHLVRFEKLRNGILGSVLVILPMIIIFLLIANVNVNTISGVGIGCFAALFLVVALMETTCWAPQKYRKGFHMLHVKWQQSAIVFATFEHKKKTLDTLLRVENPNIQLLSQDLLRLCEGPLPQAWWESLEEHLIEIVAQQATSPNSTVQKTERQQFDDVCVQVQQRCVGHFKPKVLKI